MTEVQRNIVRFRELTRNVKTSTTIGLGVCVGSSVGLFITSFIVPPTGAIDPSVLKAVAYLFAFAALFELREAVIEGLGVKLTHGNTTIEVHDMDGKPSEKPEPQDPAGEEADDSDAGETQD